MNSRSLDFLKTPIDSIILISMQNDGHRDSTVFHPCGNRLIQADWEATDTDRGASGACTRFTIFPVSKSTQVHNIYSMVTPDRFLGLEVSVSSLPGSPALSVGSFSDLVC
jgi:hypothetical protein